MFIKSRKHRHRILIYLCVALTLYILSYIYETLSELQLQPNRDLPEQLLIHTVSSRTTEKHLNKANSFTQISSVDKTENKMKYILMWTPRVNPFHLIQEGQTSFIQNECKHKNCYVTGNRNYLDNMAMFDVILFGPLRASCVPDLPKQSPTQKYIFTSMEPSSIYPANNPAYDNYFNLTWTFKLSSDIYWRYMRVYDKNGTVVGPGQNVKWLDNLDPISEDLKNKLKRKTKAAVWIVSNCKTIGGREEFVRDLDIELIKYGWVIDKFGNCSNNYCNRSMSCYKMLERTYFFYLAFENSIEEDYVTEKLVTPLENYIVPVVYGGANYSKFLPPGSYLNARELGAEALAKQMNQIIKNFSTYQDFFRWTNHYRYEHSEKLEICNLCTALNDEKLMKTETVYPNFRSWWNGEARQRTYDFLLSLFLTDKSLQRVAVAYNRVPESNKILYDLIKQYTNVSSRQIFMKESELRNINEAYYLL